MRTLLNYFRNPTAQRKRRLEIQARIRLRIEQALTRMENVRIIRKKYAQNVHLLDRDP